MKQLWWATLALAVSGAAFAAEQPYQAQGNLVAFGTPLDYQTYGYMEVWGVGSNSRYAAPATNTGDTYHALIASSEAASASALGGYGSSSVHLSYDPAASPYFVSSTGNTARYAIGPLSLQLTGPGMTPVSMTVSDTSLSVSRSTLGHSQSVSFGRAVATVEGPVPGSSFSYTAPASATVQVDLVGLLGPSAYWSAGFDLSAFASLPVRLSAPTVFRPVSYGVQLGRGDQALSYDTAPPSTLALADWNQNATIGVYYDGIYGVSVNAADYASNDAYLAAASWVDANIRQINFEQQVIYNLVDLVAVPVPEPTAAWLLLAGLVPLLLHTRRRHAA